MKSLKMLEIFNQKMLLKHFKLRISILSLNCYFVKFLIHPKIVGHFSVTFYIFVIAKMQSNGIVLIPFFTHLFK